MKKIKALFLGLIFLTVTLSQQGCIGSFQLTNNLYNWNKNELGNKWASEVVFLAFIVIPVYGVTILADGIVLNSIEFWTGDNPLAMKAGEKDSQIVQSGDDTYQLTAEKNKLHVAKIGGENSGEEGEFVWDEQMQNWTYNGQGMSFELKE